MTATEQLPDEPPITVLEVGVGEGEVTSRLRSIYTHASFVGVDLPDPARVVDWRGRGLVGLFADIGELPFPAKTFDLVLAIEVLEHVADPAKVLAELARLSRGTLVVSVPWEPVWRMANMVRGKYLRAPGQHARPRPPLDAPRLRSPSSLARTSTATSASSAPTWHRSARSSPEPVWCRCRHGGCAPRRW